MKPNKFNSLSKKMLGFIVVQLNLRANGTTEGIVDLTKDHLIITEITLGDKQ